MKRIQYYKYLTERPFQKAMELTPDEKLQEECWDYNALSGAFEWEDTYNGSLYWNRQQEKIIKAYLKDESDE